MASWRRLRTQAYLVLSVLLFLIVFLGAYALSEAKRHAVDANELLRTNFRATEIVKEIDAARGEHVRAFAKHKVTGDGAYQAMAERERGRLEGLIEELGVILAEKQKPRSLLSLRFSGNRVLSSEVTDDQALALAVVEMKQAYSRSSDSAFVKSLRDLEKRLEQRRAEVLERIMVVARDLPKTIFVALLVAIIVTSWLAMMLYQSVLKPLECLREAANRIREGEFSYRVEKFSGFEELRTLRREFNTMASKIEELDSMKSDFLSTVSHELRTPLTAIKEGLALLSEKQGELSPRVTTRTLDICTQAVKRLETMIQNLLNHARMESGFYSFDERSKNFVTVVEGAVSGVRSIAERRGQAIELHVHTDQHQAAFSTDGITHAVENLLLNAVKYGDNAHPIVVDIRRIVSESAPVPQLELRVTNRGKGLLPLELKQVFERFFRASNADGQKGVGLGLSVVKRIIEAHHGSVEAASESGLTTFYFRIPQRYETSSSALLEARA